MATGIPTFRVDLAEGMIDVDTSADRLFAYCVEADKGPVNVPTLVASNKEAMRIFGIDFAPHFYQNPTGLVITRVGFSDMGYGKIEYKDKNGKTVLTITSKYPGPCKHKVKIAPALVGDGLSLTVDIDGVTSKNYQNLRTLKKVAERINGRFSEFIVAELADDFNEATFNNKDLDVPDIEQLSSMTEEQKERLGLLEGGTNGYMLNARGEKAGAGFTQMKIAQYTASPSDSTQPGPTLTANDDVYISSNAGVNGIKYPAFSDAGTTSLDFYAVITSEKEEVTEEITDPTTQETSTITKTICSFTAYKDEKGTVVYGTGRFEVLDNVVGANYVEVDDKYEGLDTPSVEDDNAPNSDVTRIAAYREAFDKTSYVDVIGVAALSDSEVVRNVLIEHINYMADPEVHSFRFGITAVLPCDAYNGINSIDSIKGVAEFINSEWIICIGQGVMFQKENETPVELKPYQAIQLYTGIRSSLGYSEAIFGGEQKKVLRGVVDTLPLVNDGTTVIKDDIIELNEAGICTFKKEYDEVTFVEGVTTIQDEDVMSYENMMSIIAYVIKRLVRIAKPYQGQRLTEDLKTTLQTALSSELGTITSTDGTLMALEDFNIPPYDVQVYSAAKTKFDETNHLVRESKIIIQVRIVPVGALRDIDLHVIAI